MKNLKYVCSALLALSLMAIPATAQNGRSNKGGAMRSDTRADRVQSINKKQDKDRDPNTDNDKNKGLHKGEKKGKHKGATQGKHIAKGHSH